METANSAMTVPPPASLSLSEPASPLGPRSRSSSRGSHLTLDLSNLPPLIQPSPPTNTLIITNLQNPEIFHPKSLQNFRDIIASHAHVVTWSPLKSFRRIVCSFSSDEEATTVRSALDGTTLMGNRCKVYFGEHTPDRRTDQHLQAPESKKLFFISPPPSPPHGWESKDEPVPNSLVLAEDLAKALSKLHARKASAVAVTEKNKAVSAEETGGLEKPAGRTRSGSVLLFKPEEDEQHMPSISVEDLTDGSDAGDSQPQSPVSPTQATGIHTARPPVELMHDA